MAFRKISAYESQGSPSKLFGEDWGLLSAGTKEAGYNTMTIAWGNIGTLWHKSGHPGFLPTMTVYVRPQRHTYGLMEREDRFTVAFFHNGDKKILGYLGSKSGRDEDKFAGAGLTPIFEDGTVYPEEASVVFVCRKVYADVLREEGFVDKQVMEECYPARDFHTMYIGEIESVLVRE